MSQHDPAAGSTPRIRIPERPRPEPAPAPPPEAAPRRLALREDTAVFTQPPIPVPEALASEAPDGQANRFARALRTRLGGGGSTVLGVSWLNGHFHAVALVKGEIAGSFSSFVPPDDARALAEAVVQAAAHTRFEGGPVSMVFAHPRLVQQVVETPPVRDAALDTYVRRQVAQLKSFDGDAAYAAQQATITKNTEGLLLHVLPKTFVDEVQRRLEKTHLRLRNLTPVSAVLADLLVRLDIGGNEPVLIASETAQIVSMLLARPGRQVFLARSVGGGWTQGASRIALEFKRTILFANQQCGIRVNALWLVGAATPDQLAELVTETQLPVSLAPFEFSPAFWATQAARWPGDRGPNLLSPEERAAPQRRVYVRVTTLAIGFAALVALVASVALARLTRVSADNNRRLGLLRSEAQARHADLQRLYSEIDRERAAIHRLLEQRSPQIPSWFLGYLGEACPPDLAVTEARVRREEDVWKFTLSGRQQAAGDVARLPRFQESVAALTNRLSKGPFHARILSARATAETPAAAPVPPDLPPGANPTLAWMQRRLRAQQRADFAPAFAVEGVIR